MYSSYYSAKHISLHSLIYLPVLNEPWQGTLSGAVCIYKLTLPREDQSRGSQDYYLQDRGCQFLHKNFLLLPLTLNIYYVSIGMRGIVTYAS